MTEPSPDDERSTFTLPAGQWYRLKYGEGYPSIEIHNRGLGDIIVQGCSEPVTIHGGFIACFSRLPPPTEGIEK